MASRLAHLLRASIFKPKRSYLKRSILRKTILEGLERRDLMNAAPIAQDDNAYFTALNTDLVVTTSSTPAHLLANDTDVDAGSLSASVVANPSSGTLISFNSNGTFTYRPNTGFTGVDSFTYKINDGTDDSGVATVQVAVGTRLLAKQNLDSNNLFVSTVISPGVSTGLGGDGDITADPTSGALVLNEEVLPGLNFVYRSDSLEKPIIAVDTQLAPGLSVPTALSAQLIFNGVAGTTYSYNVAGLVAGQSLRFALQADGTSLDTGMYEYTLRVTSTVGGVSSSQDFTGLQSIVRRTSSATLSTQEFGKGWYVDGVDRIYDQTATGRVGALLVKGNGDTLWFPKPSSTYLAARGDLLKQTLVKNGNNTYTLTDKFGNITNFDTAGKITQRVDTNGNTTDYAYASDRLSSITDLYSRAIDFNYSSGNIASIDHYSGRTTSFSISSGKLSSYTLTDPDGAGALAAPGFSYGYNGSNQLTSRTNPKSEATSFAYRSTDGRLQTITHPDSNTRGILAIESIGIPTGTSGNAVKKAIDAQAEITDERNNIWRYRSDSLGLTTETKTPQSYLTAIYRDKDGREYIRHLPDPDGAGPLSVEAIVTGYDESGNVVFLMEPASGTKTWTYSSSNRMLSATDAVGRTKNFTYDASGNMLTEVDGAGFTTTYAYNSEGLPTSITAPDPDGAGALSAPVTGLAYDADGRLVTVTNSDSSTITFTYNTADQILTQVDELGETTTYVYDSLGRQTSITNRTSHTTSFAYDGLSRLIKQTDALGNETDTEYNNRVWVSKITYPDPDGAGPLSRPEDSRSYIATGQQTARSEAGNNYYTSRSYSFDADGRLTAKSDPAQYGSEETYSYDNRNRLIAINDPNMNPIVMTYDGAGRLLSRIQHNYVMAPSLPTIYSAVYYTYTLAGELATETDGRGNTKSFTYNSRGLLATETLPDPDGSGSQFGQVKSYSYDNIGRMLSLFDGYDRTMTLEYNSRSWVTKVTDQDPDGAGSASAPIYQFGYNNRGDRTTVTDPLGRVTTTAYDDEQRPTSVTLPDPDGAGALSSPVLSTAYNAVGWITSTTDANGGVTSTTYDNLGRVLTVTQPDPDGAGSLSASVIANEYDAQGLWKVTDAEGATITFTRDGQGRVIEQVDDDGNSTEFEYDYYGNLTKKIEPDPDGVGPLTRPTTNYSYDPAKRQISKTEPNGAATYYAYDVANNLTSLTDPAGNITNFGYDGQNRLVINTNALSKSKSYIYDVSGNLTRTVDRNGRTIQYVHDGLDRVIEEKWITNSANPSLSVSTTTQGGNLNEVQRVGWTASSSMSGTFTLTFSGQTTSAISASATAAQVASALEALSNIGTGDVQVELLDAPYGTGDRIYRVTFQGALAATNVAQISIDVSNITGGYYSSPSAVQATDVVGGVYSEVQQITLSNSSGGTWRLAYNGEVTAPLAHNANAAAVESALESLNGIDQVTVTGSSGSFTVTFAGSHANLPMDQIFGDAANSTNGTTVRTITSEYNVASELVSISDPSSTIEYTRDNLGRATSIENVIAGLTPAVILGQVFDAASNRTELNATIGSTADFKNSYSYDAVNRLIDIVQQSQSGGNAVTAKHVKIGYNGNHQQALIERFQSTGTSNSVAATTFTYDLLNRLSLLEHEQGSTVLSTYDYAYDGLSRFTSIDSSIEGLSSFEYDASGQLTDADHASQTDETYTYNANGSRSMTGYTTSTNNRTTAMPGFTFSYDDEGNRTRKTQTSNGHVQDYEWDHRNRLTSVKFRNSVGGSITKQVDYEYDAYNRLVKRTYDADGAGGGSATNQYWVYDEGINAVLQFDGNAASNLSHRYLWSDKVDQLLADEQVTSLGSGGNVLWALSDHLGTIRDIADFDESTGITAIANHRKYNAFGALISETNSAVDLIYGFTGKQLDEATYLQHNLNRWYDSALGQWLSEDPIGFDAGDENLRRYVSNSSMKLRDLDGLQETDYDPNPGLHDYLDTTIKEHRNEMQNSNWAYEGNNCSDAAYKASEHIYEAGLSSEQILPHDYAVNAIGIGYSWSVKNDSTSYRGSHSMLYVGNSEGGYLIDPQTRWVSSYVTAQEINQQIQDKMYESYLTEGNYTYFNVTNTGGDSNSSYGRNRENDAYSQWAEQQRNNNGLQGGPFIPYGQNYKEATDPNWKEKYNETQRKITETYNATMQKNSAKEQKDSRNYKSYLDYLYEAEMRRPPQP